MQPPVPFQINQQFLLLKPVALGLVSGRLSLLLPCSTPFQTGTAEEEEGSLSSSSDEEYEIERVLDRRVSPRTGRVEYYVKWLGDWGRDSYQWLDEGNMGNAQEAVRTFMEQGATAAATKSGKAIKRLTQESAGKTAARRQAFIVSDNDSSDSNDKKQKPAKKKKHKRKSAEVASARLAASTGGEVEEGEISDSSSSGRRHGSGRSKASKQAEHRRRRHRGKAVNDGGHVTETAAPVEPAEPPVKQPEPQPKVFAVFAPFNDADQTNDEDDDDDDDDAQFSGLRIAETGDTPSEAEADGDDNGNDNGVYNEKEEQQAERTVRAAEADDISDSGDVGGEVQEGEEEDEEDGSVSTSGPSDPRRLQPGSNSAAPASTESRQMLPTGAVIRKRQIKLLSLAGREIVKDKTTGHGPSGSSRTDAAHSGKSVRSGGDSDAWKATLSSELANPARQVSGSSADIMRILLVERDAEFPPRLLTERELVDLVRDPDRPLMALSQALRHPDCPSLNVIPESRPSWLLHTAAKYGLTEALQLLLQFGADPDLPERRTGRTALMTAAGLGLQIACDLLLQARANLELRDHRGDTALMRAARQSQFHTMNYLLWRGAEFNALWPGRAAGIPEEALKISRLWSIELQALLLTEIEQVVGSCLPGAQITCSVSSPFVVSPGTGPQRVLTFSTPEDLKEGPAGRSLDCLFIAVAHFPGTGTAHPMLSGPDMVSGVRLNGVTQPSFTPPHHFLTGCQPLRPPGETNELELQLPQENSGMGQLRVLLQAYRLCLD